MGTFYVIPKDEDLQHYGILGMKWGVRRYQNADGSLTAAGKRRYQNEETAITKARKTSRGYAIGNVLLGPVGGIAGAIKGFNTKESDVNKRHLERDMTTLQRARINDAEKSKKQNITPEGKNARRLYEAVNPNATPEQTRNALSKAFYDAKRNQNIEKAAGVAASIGLMALRVGVNIYKAEQSAKRADNARKAAENIRNWANNFRAEDYVNFSRNNEKTVDYGKIYTDTELKEFKNIDINKIKSAGGDF